MKRTICRRGLAAAIVVLASWAGTGCDSLLDAPCADGYELVGDSCVLGGGPDGGPGVDATAGIDGTPGPDAGPRSDAGMGPDAFSCPVPLTECAGDCVDLSTDPDNCGSCGHVCASGICIASACVGDVSGHVVAIGHDYAQHNAAMARLLGNSIALGQSPVVQIGWYRGTASGAAHAGAVQSANQGLNAIGRPHATTQISSLAELTGFDVVVIDAQRGNGANAEATGAANAAVLDTFLTAGGVVVVLEGANGVSYRLARGAALFDVPGTQDVSGQAATVVAPADAIAQLVLSPYLADQSSATFTGAPAHTVDVGGEALAFHLTW